MTTKPWTPIVGYWVVAEPWHPRQIVAVGPDYVTWRYRANHAWALNGWATVTSPRAEWKLHCMRMGAVQQSEEPPHKKVKEAEAEEVTA